MKLEPKKTFWAAGGRHTQCERLGSAALSVSRHYRSDRHLSLRRSHRASAREQLYSKLSQEGRARENSLLFGRQTRGTRAVTVRVRYLATILGVAVHNMCTPLLFALLGGESERSKLCPSAAGGEASLSHPPVFLSNEQSGGHTTATRSTLLLIMLLQLLPPKLVGDNKYSGWPGFWRETPGRRMLAARLPTPSVSFG